MKLDRARFLITGGGSGLGRQLARQAAVRGAEVEVWDLSESAAAQTAQSTAGSYQVVDVTDAQQVRRAGERSGRVDVLINCAGLVTGKSLLESDEAAIRRTFEVNTLAHYWTTRTFLPGMLSRDHGKVVTIASAAALVGVARQTDYSASKWAAFGFTESLRAELRGSGSQVTTLTVAPYYIDTGMFAGVRTRVPLLLPILSEPKVATQILDAIATDRAQLILPPLARVVPWLRVLPVPVFDAVMDLFGINHTMDHFTGRPG